MFLTITLNKLQMKFTYLMIFLCVSVYSQKSIKITYEQLTSFRDGFFEGLPDSSREQTKKAMTSPMTFELFNNDKISLFKSAEVKDILIPSWKELGITVEILSSTMRTNPLRSELEQQKINWCNKYLPDLKLNLVEGSALKQDYAKPNTLLIDDFNRTIKQFIIKGGYALHYTSLNTTMKKLRLLGLSPP